MLTLKLKTEALLHLPATVTVPQYDRQSVKSGIVHIGVGGFHRAHQAVYTEKLFNQECALEWGICGIGLRSEDRSMKDVLASQDYLYSVCELGDAPNEPVQVVGAINDFLLAEDDPVAVIEKMALPEVRIVSLTITEGGYCTDDSTGKFNAHLPEVQHDLDNPLDPKTVFGFLVQALTLRRTMGIKPFTVMSCDNLPHNGDATRRALLAFARLVDSELESWIARYVSFPNSMVDRITPTTTDAHRQQLLAEYEIEDRWPVVCEPFCQWVLEDRFCNGRPAWETVGVQFTDDVAPYEKMKIGLLNGGHFAMAYLGLLSGYEFSCEAMQDSLLRRYLREFMDKDVSPLLGEVPGMDLEAYKTTLIERFSNRGIRDQLGRIGSDGASKFPKFILPTLNELIKADRPLDRIALCVAAWVHCLDGMGAMGSESDKFPISDLRLDCLQRAIRHQSGPVKLFEMEEVFGQIVPNSEAFRQAFDMQLERLQSDGVEQALQLTLMKTGELVS